MTTEVTIKIQPQGDEAIIGLQREIGSIYSHATGFVVANPQDVKRAVEDLSLIANLRKALEGKRKEYTEPLNTHLKEINATFKTFSDPLDAANKILRDKVGAYNQEQQRLKDEAEKADALRKQAAEIEAKLTQETGEIFSENKPSVVIPEAQVVNKAYTEVGNMGTRKVRKWREIDFAKIPDAYKEVNVAKISKVVKAGIPEIPGIEIYEEDTLVISATK